ncbi:hypothetical protein [Aquimarina rhabdastrellae]
MKFKTTNERREKVENWLHRHRDIINTHAIDREIGVAEGSIQKFLKYNRRINDQRIDALYLMIDRMNS